MRVVFLRPWPRLARGCASAASALRDCFPVLIVERRFDLDERSLHASYKRLMAEVHPDRHGGASAEQQQRVADEAASITDAFGVLQRPHQRAVHLLELLGRPLEEGTGGDVLGTAFLMEVMEVRESLEDAGTSAAALQPLREANDARMGELYRELAAAFAAHDLGEAHALTARLQYVQRIDDEIKARMPVV